MVSNDEIRQRLDNKRDRKSGYGYLVCDKCGGSYELQLGERPEDFNLNCDCGGHLKYNENLKIADPYTDKTSDPWNDKYIATDTYPNLIAYPDGKTEVMERLTSPSSVYEVVERRK